MVTGLLMRIIYNIIQNDFSLAYTNLLSIMPNTRYDVHIRLESNQDAIVSPVQDAGLQTYMRTLNINFTRDV